MITAEIFTAPENAEGIVNKFEEILRHNNVSYNDNSFNKLIELLMCKIEDELSHKDNDEMDFQYKTGQKEFWGMTGTAGRELKGGKAPVYGTSSVQVIRSGQARGFHDFNFTKHYYLAENVELDERKLRKGDLLINSLGVGTAGRVTAFDLNGDYVTDSTDFPAKYLSSSHLGLIDLVVKAAQNFAV